MEILKYYKLDGMLARVTLSLSNTVCLIQTANSDLSNTHMHAHTHNMHR